MNQIRFTFSSVALICFWLTILVSVTTADWKLASKQFCDKNHICTNEYLTWHSNPPLVIYDGITACKLFADRGITEVYTYGDSFIRHIYAAMLLLLTDNYETGCLSKPEVKCLGKQQFNEKRCNTELLKINASLCNGHLDWPRDAKLPNRLSSIDPPIGTFKNNNGAKGKVLLWSQGNHPLHVGREKNIRIGVNNASEQIEYMQKYVCPVKKWGYEKVFWLSTHARILYHHDDERPEVIRKYNEDMRTFFESDGCGEVSYIDVYNMTASLVMKQGSMVMYNALRYAGMSFDGTHWGREVNVLKAQIIINALAS